MVVRDLWHYVHVSQAKKKGVQPCKCGRGDTVKYPTTEHQQDKRWRVQLYVNSKPYGSAEHFDDYREAKARDEKLTDQLNKGRKPADRMKGKETLRSHLQEYIEQRASEEGKEITIGARRKYRSNLKCHIMPYFGEHTTIADIGPHEMRKFRDHMATKRKGNGQHYSQSVVVGTYGLLASALNYAVATEKIVENPSAKVPFPKEKEDGKGKFTLWEVDLVKRLLDALPAYDRTIAMVAATCGHRQGEAFGVCVEDIHGDLINVQHQVARDEAGVVRLSPPKFNSVRFGVPLPNSTARALAQHMAEHDPLPVTCTCHPGKTWRLLFSRRGRPMLSQTWNVLWHKALRCVERQYAAEGLTPPVDLEPDGDNDTGMHQLRHHAISLWLYGGTTPLAVAEWVGHSSIREIELIYGHVFSDEGKRGRTIMQKVYGVGGGEDDDGTPPRLTVVR